MPTDEHGPSMADLIGEIPEEVVAAIAFAAVEAYKKAVRQKEAAYQRAYQRRNRERLNRLKAERASDKRVGLRTPLQVARDSVSSEG